VPIPDHLPIQFHPEAIVDGILTGLEELVIMDIPFSPIRLLVVQNIRIRTSGLIRGPPKDAVRMRIAGFQISRQRTVIPIEGIPVVVPMDGHGDRVGNKGTAHGFL
jgi:hypothetical protein